MRILVAKDRRLHLRAALEEQNRKVWELEQPAARFQIAHVGGFR
jgi:hypothetical protein